MSYEAKSALGIKIAAYGKSIAAFVGVLLTVVSQVTPILHFLPGAAQVTVTSVVGALTVISVFVAKYGPTTAQAADDVAELGRAVRAVR